MRTLTIRDNKTFVTGELNQEYYVKSNAHDTIPLVITRLAEVMEVDRVRLDAAMAFISSQGAMFSLDDYEPYRFMTPNESRAVVELWIFICEVAKADHAYEKKWLEYTASYVHVNMNTGDRVVWTHVLG